MDVVAATRTGFACALDDPRATDGALVGSKAASLARSAAEGLPVVPGFVLTTAAHRAFQDAGGRLPDEVRSALLPAWRALSRDGAHPVVVRSSSTVEDVESSSMAGRFRSVLDVRDPSALEAAVLAVLRSADEVAGDHVPGPMGVLVQRHVDAARGGVMFGVDPVTGDTRHIVIEAVVGGPEKLVSGRVTAQHYLVTRRGRLVSLDRLPVRTARRSPHARRLLGRTELLLLSRLARRTERVFGGPQDVEWAIEDDGTMLLLQSRPVTATADGTLTGPVLGPGPLGETFPDPLSVLETDLWVRPLRAGVLDALAETRAVPAHRLQRSPVVLTVSGRVAADLELLGYVPAGGGALAALDPRPRVRRLAAAWHTGLLRAALPERTSSLVAEVDRRLAAVDLSCSEAALVETLREAVALLRSLHRDEVLAGSLLPPSPTTAAKLALEVLGSADVDPTAANAVREHPVLLALTPPSLAGTARLPATPPRPAGRTRIPASVPLAPREALRLRARWTQELTARVVAELERRLVVRGVVRPGTLALLSVDELGALVTQNRLPEDLHVRRAEDLADALGPPLPAEFRLSEHGQPVPVARRGARPGTGVPAGGGRGVGPVVHGSVRRTPQPGDVLVVRELSPSLAGYLPGLAGLVAETGSALSHLAILAREYDVPTVVAVHDALRRFAPGTRLYVDGTTGEVRPVEGGDSS